MHKYLLLALCVISWTVPQAQSTVSLRGQINNFQPEGTIYISNGHLTTPLEVDENGAFETELQYGELPGFFALNSTSKKGKITPEIPRIWIKDESVDITIDWNDRSVSSSSPTSYQELSDRIEALHGQKQIDLVLATPNQVPSMYWADRLKEKMAIQDLITYLKDTRMAINYPLPSYPPNLLSAFSFPYSYNGSRLALSIPLQLYPKPNC